VGLEKSEDEVLFFEGGITGEFEVASDVAQLRYSFCFKFGDIHVVLGRGRSKSMGSNTPFLLSLLNLEFDGKHVANEMINQPTCRGRLLWSPWAIFRKMSERYMVTTMLTTGERGIGRYFLETAYNNTTYSEKTAELFCTYLPCLYIFPLAVLMQRLDTIFVWQDDRRRRVVYTLGVSRNSFNPSIGQRVI
jgi:hypothetical protein